MKISLLKGRLGNHRFHPMLVHFPSALYPFSLAMDILGQTVGEVGDPGFGFAGLYALEGAVGMSVFAMVYGTIDFLQIDPQSQAWKKAGVHALLNLSWWIVYASLLFYRIKHPDIGWTYIVIMSMVTAGLIVSNYLGADLIIKHRVGIEPSSGDGK